MRRIVELTASLLTVFIMLFSTFVDVRVVKAYSQSGEAEYTIDEPYEYPIKPDTPEWLEKDTAEKMAMLHVPPEIADKMTTRALLLTYVTYPYAARVGAFEMEARRFYLQDCENDYVLRLFSEREDATRVLLDEIYSLGTRNDLEDYTKDMYTPAFVYLIVQPEYNSRMSENEIYDFVHLMLGYKNSPREPEYDELRYISMSFIYSYLWWMKIYQYFDSYPYDDCTEEELMDNPLVNRVSFDILRQRGWSLLP